MLLTQLKVFCMESIKALPPSLIHLLFTVLYFVGNHAAPHSLRILPLSLDTFRGRALPSGIRRLRTRAWEASGSWVSL